MTGKMKRLKSRCLLALCLSAAPAVLHALGLGEIHLHSALNEPLRADIELLSATPEELRTLTAAVASRETLARYGVEPSRQLSNLQFDVARDEAGRNVLRVTSTRAIDDPFLTFLVEVSWPRGRLLREYTLLLDPPVYMPGEAGQGPAVAPPQAQTPRTTEPQRSAEPATRPISAEDPQPQDNTALPSTPARSAAPTGDATSYTVQQNDTLWRISSELTADGGPREINRMMVAMFRANPEAFGGNINDLRAGAILRIPGGSELEALGPGEATAEVRRQYAEWRAQRGESESARLKLVTPAEPAVVGSGAAAGDASALNQKVRELETQLAEMRRMLELKNAELARLQQRLGETAAAEPAPPVETPSTTQPEASPATQAEAPPIDAQTAEPPVTTEPPIEAPSAESPPVPAETSSSFLDWLIQNWYFPVAALLLLGGLIFAFLRRRQEPDFAALGRLAQEHSREREEPKVEDQRSTTARLRALKKEDNFLVEESGEREQLRMEPSTRAPAAAPKPAAKATAAPKPKLAEEVQPEAPAKKSTEDTLSSETAINLDQGDPLAEADFHMAYGLYDQAADLVRIALEREPGRRELHLKLLEIYFVWGNKDAFLQAARELKASAGEAPAGEWDKIVIMGKQIAPEDSLFAGAGTRAGAADVDLNLEEGDNPLDLDILGPETQSGNRAVDLDLSADGSDSTNEMPDLKGSSGIDFVFDEPTPTPDTSATTREMPARASGSSAEAEAPTVESPALRDKSSSTIREKIESAHFRKAGRNTDQTAELAIDDLGLDVNALGGGKTESLDAMEETDHPRDETGETAHTLEALEETDHPEDAATLLASLDDTARNRLARAESGEEDDPDRTRNTARIKQPEDSSPTTGTWVIDDEAIMTSPAVGAGDATVRTPSPRKSDRAPSPRKPDDDATADLKKMGAEEVELDLSSLEAALSADTVQQPRPGGADEDRFSSDVFGGSQDFTQTDTAVDPNGGGAHAASDRDSTRTERLPAQEMDLPELEPVTMSEVGTKLDLARAYLDMGDPEGARSILDEVMQEGTATQKQEAQRLIESLPG